MPRPLVLVLVLAIGCQRSSPADPAPAPPRSAESPLGATGDSSAPAPKPTTAVPPPVAEPSTCVALCLEARMAQARAPEAIEADCHSHCGQIATLGTPESCETVAREARDAVEKHRMPRRAVHVWQQLENPSVHCDRSGPTIAALAAAGTTKDPKSRDTALQKVVRADTLLTEFCPAGPTAFDRAAAAPRPQRIDALIRECPLPAHPPEEPVYHDLGLGTFAAIIAIEHRWTALHIESADHRTLLNILRLSTALESNAD